MMVNVLILCVDVVIYGDINVCNTCMCQYKLNLKFRIDILMNLII